MMKLIFTLSFFLLVYVTDNKVLCASQTSYSYYYEQGPQNNQYGVGICSNCKTCPGQGFSSYIQVSTPYTPYTPHRFNSPCGPNAPYRPNMPFGPYAPSYDPKNMGVCPDCRNQGNSYLCPAQVVTPKPTSKKPNSKKENKRPGLKKKIEDAIYNGKDALRDYGRNIKSFFEKCGNKFKGAFKKNKKPPPKTSPCNGPQYNPASMYSPQCKWK